MGSKGYSINRPTKGQIIDEAVYDIEDLFYDDLHPDLVLREIENKVAKFAERHGRLMAQHVISILKLEHLYPGVFDAYWQSNTKIKRRKARMA